MSVIVLFLDSNSVAEAVLDSVKRQWNIEDKTIVWIAPDYWGTSSYFLQGMFARLLIMIVVHKTNEKTHA